MECLALRTLLMWAYDVQDYQVSGGPAWAQNMRWDIVASDGHPEGSAASATGYAAMTDSTRAQFMDHVRQRTRTLLADRFGVVIHRENREQEVYTLVIAKVGSKLTDAPDGRGPLIKRGWGRIEGQGAKTADLTRFLATDLRRPVTDGTGLTGRYDFDLKWTPDVPASGSGDTPPAGDDGVSLFTAIRRGQRATPFFASGNLPERESRDTIPAA